jgi:hypothetical protein
MTDQTMADTHNESAGPQSHAQDALVARALHTKDDTLLDAMTPVLDSLYAAYSALPPNS